MVGCLADFIYLLSCFYRTFFADAYHDGNEAISFMIADVCHK